MNSTVAVITGAGDGLGRSFALECAARGYGLMLVSLPGSKLDRLRQQISTHYGVQVYWLETDLCDEKGIDELLRMIDAHNMNIRLLINNAGLGHSCAFDALSLTYLHKQLVLNIEVLTLLTYRLLPYLKTSGNAHIINISSMAGLYTLPYKNTYAASKAYVKQLSLSLRGELQPYGIHVSVVCPGGIRSNPHQYRVYRSGGCITRMSFMHPDEVAAYTLSSALSGKAFIIPGCINRIIYYGTLLLPPYIKKLLGQSIMKPTVSGLALT